MEIFYQVGLALAIGLLVGLERGWQQRRAAEGNRIAGIRTFGLIGLLGGLWAVIAKSIDPILMGFGLLALAGLLIIAHIEDVREDHDVGITTIVSALLTFVLGTLPPLGFERIAVSAGVLVTIMLSLKPKLHQWVRKLEWNELTAILKLLLISVVLLPVLPNQGYGPWNVLNPYHIWWMVVLIAGISFVGYFAMKLIGTRKGLMLTGLFGGLASSTALTLDFAHFAKKETLSSILVAGVMLASASMFPRVLVEVSFINANLLASLALPMVVMTLAALSMSLWFWFRRESFQSDHSVPISNPFEIGTALKFALVLVIVMVLAEAAQVWMGEHGIYLLALISGLADVDAITLSLARMAHTELTSDVAVTGIVIGAMTNTMVKGFLFTFIAGTRAGLKLIIAMLVTIACGGLSLLYI